MKILLIGKDGQVGWELQRSLAALGQLHAVGRDECDLSDAEAVRNLVQGAKPDIIVNAAAYTAVDKAESNVQLAQAINTQAPAILAEAAKELDAWLVHYSTDYVFDGSKVGAYLEQDMTNPLSVYGRTKLKAEHAISQSGCKHLIFRTSWVFAARGANFAKTMLRLARERDTLNVVGDQFGAPTSAELIADVTALCLYKLHNEAPALANQRAGIYHLVSSGVTTWHDFAHYVISYAIAANQTLKCQPSAVLAITAAEYPTPAQRPANSRLDTSKLQVTFNISLPDWNYHVKRMLDEILV